MPDDRPTSIEINGVTLSGPADKLAEILAKVQQQHAEEAQDRASRPANASKARPNEQHTGIHELLDLHERGELKARCGIELSADEEEGLRTYGRSGPAVDSVERAVDVILQWRAWELKGQMGRG